MARNLFILSALTLLAGCSTPELPPSSSGAEAFVPSTAVAPVGPVTTTAPTAPSGIPAKKKLPLGTVRQK
ncbi:MAG TPA: hypothetical protein DCY41_08340 [Opitutae bacterium]|nr:hypothetical protein [Opitutae bacterium]